MGGGPLKKTRVAPHCVSRAEREVHEAPAASSVYQSNSLVVTKVKVSQRSRPLGKIDGRGVRRVEKRAARADADGNVGSSQGSFLHPPHLILQFLGTRMGSPEVFRFC